MTKRSDEYAQDSGDAEFTAFMDRVDRTVSARLGLSVFDFADAAWWDLFDECPDADEDAILETLAEADDLVRMHLDGEG